VCASHDPKAFKCNIQIRLQPPKVEIIQDLEAIIKEQLIYFHQKTNCKPERIIFYRDGVSEGQFPEVCFKIQRENDNHIINLDSINLVTEKNVPDCSIVYCVLHIPVEKLI
jgi:hypothetical protein